MLFVPTLSPILAIGCFNVKRLVQWATKNPQVCGLLAGRVGQIYYTSMIESRQTPGNPFGKVFKFARLNWTNLSLKAKNCGGLRRF